MPIAIPLAVAAAAGTAGYVAANSQKKAGQAAAASQPSYEDSVTNASNAQMSLLPAQVAVDRAARLGQTYTDPASGRTYNFAGMGDEQLNELDAAQQERLSRAGADLQRNLTRDQYTDLMDLMPKYNQLNLQSQKDAYDASLEASRRGTANSYDQSLEYMPRFGALQRGEDSKTYRNNLDLGDEGARRAADLQDELLPRMNALQRNEDATSYRANLDLGEEGAQRNVDLQKRLLPEMDQLLRDQAAAGYRQNLDLSEEGSRRYTDLQQELAPRLNQTGLDMQRAAEKASMDSYREDDPSRYAMREQLYKQVNDELAAGDQLTDRQKEQLQQKIRGAQSARGNILGAGAGYDEAMLEKDAGMAERDKRRATALQIIQGTEDRPRFAATGAVPMSLEAPGSVNADGVSVPAPDYRSTAAVNPLMPNYQSPGMVNPQSPNFAATTTGAPNLNPVPVGQSGSFSYVNPNSVQQGANSVNQAWQQKSNLLMNLPNPWATGLGSAAGAFGSMYAA